MSGLLGLLFTKLTLPPASAIQGKTVLITGANTGLGREAARHAARLGAGTIIMGVRSLDKGEEAKSDIESSITTSNSNPCKTKFLIWPVDLESFTSVKAFITRVQKHVLDEGGRLDMAIMNAGVASMQFTVSADGWEKQLQVNVLSTALLALRLMPLLMRTRERDPAARSNLTLVTSDNHMSVKFAERERSDGVLRALNDEGQWKKSQAAGGPTERYGVTKLMDLFIAEELAIRTPRDPRSGEPLVVVNGVAPGFCKSELLAREKAPWILKVVQALIARSVEDGSKTLLHAVTAGVETHGKYLDHQAIAV
jgi:NAD(P)-dependent dehydrogenase (short-subunit alcohol dehydrogenase family)